MTFVQHEAFAQAKWRPATAADFTGIFRLIPYPEDKQPKFFKENPWPGTCQFFGHYPTGYWAHDQLTQIKQGQVQTGSCANTLSSKKPALAQTVSWQTPNDGAVLIERSDYKIKELWKVDRVTGVTTLGGVNLNDGDLIMQLSHQREKRFIWVRLLRRIGDASN